jgi:quercetin dioxygenase-like cupin family protein
MAYDAFAIILRIRERTSDVARAHGIGKLRSDGGALLRLRRRLVRGGADGARPWDPYGGHGTERCGAGSRPATKAKPVSCEQLPHVPGKSITTVLVHFPPDGFSPRHRHAGSVTVHVLSGTVRSQLDNGPIGTFKAGESFFEPPGAIHTFAENASKTEPAEILAIFVADDCAQLTTYLSVPVLG